MLTRALLTFVACALLGAAAGCGGNGGGDRLPKGEYESRMQTLQQRLSSTAEALAGVKANDIGSSVRALRQVGDLFEEAAAELGKINPPEDIAEPHERLAEGCQEAADRYNGLADRLEDASLTEASGILRELSDPTGLQKVQQAVAEIQAKGYDIGGG